MNADGDDLGPLAGVDRHRRGSQFLGLFLRRRTPLAPDLLRALSEVSVDRRTIEDGQTIVPAGPTPDHSCLLIRGAAMRSHPDPAGAPMVSALCLPGDFMDLHAYLLDNLDHETVAVGRTVVEFVEHDVLDALVAEYPALTRAFWRETLVEAKIHRAWVVAASRLQASQRIAHLLCEIEVRLARVGLADQGHFSTPLDQKRMADVLGLSAVHVNRAVQELRATDLLSWKGRAVHLSDRTQIRRFARFDPGYLDC